MVPTYRERLRTEGLTLAATSAAGSALLLATTPQSRRWPLNTGWQLAAAAVILATAGRRAVRKALDEAVELEPGAEGGGDPTPLWHVPLPMIALAFGGVPMRGWDGGLRATTGSLLAGLAQALLFDREVAQAETIQDRTYYRVPGSRLLTGTRLGYVRRG